jgi:hypothetical protein
MPCRQSVTFPCPLMTCTSVGVNEYATKVVYLIKQIGVILACRPETFG